MNIMPSAAVIASDGIMSVLLFIQLKLEVTMICVERKIECSPFIFCAF